MNTRTLLLLTFLLITLDAVRTFHLEPLYVDPPQDCAADSGEGEDQTMLLVPVLDYKGPMKPDKMEKIVKEMFSSMKIDDDKN